MRTFWNYFFLLCMITIVTSDQNVCEPLAEGSSRSLTCDFSGIKRRFPGIIWYLEDKYGQKRRKVGICYFEPDCHSLEPHSFDVRSNESMSILTIKNASRIDRFNSEGRWICKMRMISADICDNFEVYAKPQKPVCALQLLDSQSHLSVTCRTDHVYPQAGCDFLGSWDKHNVYTPLEGRISYNHTAKNETPVYYKSECTLELAVSSLKDGNIFIKVNMYPNVTDGNRYGVESNVVSYYNGNKDVNTSRIILTQDPTGSPENSESNTCVRSNNSKGSNKSTESTKSIESRNATGIDSSTWHSSYAVIGLAVAVATTTVVAVVLAGLMIHYKNKYKTLASATKGYDFIDISQSDVVNSYETTTTNVNAAFSMDIQGYVQCQEETLTQDRVYENVEDEPRPETKGEDVYEN